MSSPRGGGLPTRSSRQVGSSFKRSQHARGELVEPRAFGSSFDWLRTSGAEMSSSAYALLVLFAINLMNFFDRQIIGGVGEGIRREWGLSDTALGLLGTVFTLLYAVVGLPLGRLSDRKPRRLILAAGVFTWSLLTALSGAARSFAQLV